MVTHNQTCGPPQQDEKIDPEKYIASVVHMAMAKMQTEQKDEANTIVMTQSILKQAKNNQA